MEGVLDAALCLCVFRLMISVLLCPSVLTHTITAVSLCCCCLFLFTDLAVTLFLLYLWLMEFWMMPFCVPSDVIALRFLLFLCQVYGVVLLLTPPLVAVELLVNMLQAQDLQIKQNANESHHNQCLSKTVGFIGCLLAWIVSAIYCSHDWTLEQISVEDCFKKGGWFVLCLSNVDELYWGLPALFLLLSLGVIRTKASRRPPENTQDYVVLRQTDISVTPVESEKAAVSCGVHRVGFVYSEPRWLCAEQTGLTDNCIQKQRQSSSHAMFACSKSHLMLEVSSLTVKTDKKVFNSRRSCLDERGNPCLGPEMFTGLVCVALVCVFPTVVSSNILLILKLENCVALLLKF